MIDLRDLELLVSLSRHGNFARAARECAISQPAFSARIQKLETQLGVAVVKRGNRFMGFTEQGETLLIRARRLLDDARMLEQEIAAAPGEPRGALKIGVIPTAIAFTAKLCAQLHAAHPGVVAALRSMTALQIQEAVEDRAIDIGVTYAEGAPPGVDGPHPLLDETYVLLAPMAVAPRAEGTASWAEAAALPLCLLEPSMQNRRILDAQFTALGLRPEIVMETNEFVSALVLLKTGQASTIVPDAMATALAPFEGVAALPLTQPALSTPIRLIYPRDKAASPAVEAFRRIANAP